MTAQTTPDIADATNAELLATAIPVGVAKSSFSTANDALLAVFTFGLAIGVEDSTKAQRLADVGESILRAEPQSEQEYENFLRGVEAFIRAALA
jgi:hypothetical protein